MARLVELDPQLAARASAPAGVVTVDERRWFADSGFEDVAFVGPDDLLFGVGMHRLVAAPAACPPNPQLFWFVGYDTLR